MTVDPLKQAVGVKAQRLAEGYYAFVVAQYVAASPQAINSLPPALAGEDPTGRVPRKDGTYHVLNLRHYLDQFRTDQSLQEEILRTWATGSLLAMGDELLKHDYFDHAPVLELVYHLRNAMAHGNRFHITDGGRRRLANFPGHNEGAAVRSPDGTIFRISPGLVGPVLFDYMGPADIIDLLQSVSVHLFR